jgi:2-dehydro-3-deoxygalactonokinase
MAAPVMASSRAALQPIIAVDWGLTSCRAWRFDSGGQIVEARSGGRGVLKIEGGAFGDALEEFLAGWIDAGEAPIVMCGMIGSRQGWVEAPYVDIPAGMADLAASLAPVPFRRAAFIVPGVVQRTGSVPDVMRGEETQVAGALPSLGSAELFCLPGTHSKWVVTEGDRIRQFSTHMTGEVFDLLCRHSILGRLMTEGETNPEMFQRGVRRAAKPGGVLHHIFGARTLGLVDGLGGADLRGYLSGVLIGAEITAALAEAPGERPIRLIGAPALCALYGRALDGLGRASVLAGEEVAALGLAAIWRRRSEL